MEFEIETVDLLVVWLRSVGLILLKKTLPFEKNDPPALPEMNDLFTVEWTTGLRERATEGASLNTALSTEQTYPEVIRRTIIRSPLDLTLFSSFMNYEIERRLLVNALYRLPKSLWSLIETRSWRDPTFMVETALEIEHDMRRRVLFTSKERITFRLHPRTFWVLVEMACLNAQKQITTMHQSVNVNRGGLRPFFRPRSFQPLVPTMIVTACEDLRAMAVEFGREKSQWASLWDQWVLLKAQATWGNSGYPPELTRALASLPLRHYKPDETVRDEPAINTGGMAHPDWQKSIPAWFKSWHSNKYYTQWSI